MKCARLIALRVLAWVLFPAHAGAQDKISQVETIVVGGPVTLTWGASQGQICTTDTPPVCTPNNDPISYKVYVSGTNGGPYSPIGTTVALSYKDLAVTSGSTYYYVVTAIDGTNNEESAYSNQASATIP